VLSYFFASKNGGFGFFGFIADLVLPRAFLYRYRFLYFGIFGFLSAFYYCYKLKKAIPHVSPD
jgi:hypothetical protein